MSINVFRFQNRIEISESLMSYDELQLLAKVYRDFFESYPADPDALIASHV